MGLFGLFKKKEKPLDLPDLDLTEPSPEQRHLEAQAQQFPPLQYSPMQQPMQDDTNKLILAKLETINAQLENLNQRIANLEKIAAASQEPTQPWYTRR